MTCDKCGLEIPVYVTCMMNFKEKKYRHAFDCTTEWGRLHALALIDKYSNPQK